MTALSSTAYVPRSSAQDTLAQRRRADVPPGMRSDPSAWRLRLPVVALVLVGFAVATWLTLMETGALSSWDPFTSGGTDRVLHSAVAEAIPVPDAALGAVAYAVEAVLLLTGPSGRWRKMPWAALATDAAVLAMAVAGVGLVLLQALVVHAWCTLCLVSAGISVTVLVVTRLAEARAALPVVTGAHRQGAAWIDAVLGESHDAVRTPALAAARAGTAATMTFAGGLVLVVTAVWGYRPLRHPSEAVVLRDSALGVVLCLLALAGMAAAGRARKSSAGVIAVGVLLVALAVFTSGPDAGVDRAFWAELLVGGVAVLGGATRLLSTSAAGQGADPLPPLPELARHLQDEQARRAAQGEEGWHPQQPVQPGQTGGGFPQEESSITVFRGSGGWYWALQDGAEVIARSPGYATRELALHTAESARRVAARARVRLDPMAEREPRPGEL